MVCLRNISVDTLHKGDTEDDDNNNNNNNNNNKPSFTLYTNKPLFICVFIYLFTCFLHGARA